MIGARKGVPTALRERPLSIPVMSWEGGTVARRCRFGRVVARQGGGGSDHVPRIIEKIDEEQHNS